jgi:hypothetical protein
MTQGLAAWAQSIYAGQATRYGKTITYRRVTTLGTPPALVTNPCTNGTLQVATTASPGATSIALAAPTGSSVQGFLTVGDTLKIGNDTTTYTVTANSIASSNAFAAVPISPPLAQAASSGASVAVTFQADTTLKAWVRSFHLGSIDNNLVRVGDVLVRIAGSSLSSTPVITDFLIINNLVKRVLSVDSGYAATNPGYWDIHAR